MRFNVYRVVHPCSGGTPALMLVNSMVAESMAEAVKAAGIAYRGIEHMVKAA